MTPEDIKFYYGGRPPYPVTIDDVYTGHPIGMLFPDGTNLMCGTSNVGKETVEGYIVVWDGSMKDPNPGCHSKGRLLPVDGPSYVDSITVFKSLARKVRGNDDEEGLSLDGEKETGSSGPAPRETKRDSPTRAKTGRTT